MNPGVLLQLIHDLQAQLIDARATIQRLEADLAAVKSRRKT